MGKWDSGIATSRQGKAGGGGGEGFWCVVARCVALSHDREGGEKSQDSSIGGFEKSGQGTLVTFRNAIARSHAWHPSSEVAEAEVQRSVGRMTTRDRPVSPLSNVTYPWARRRFPVLLLHAADTGPALVVVSRSEAQGEAVGSRACFAVDPGNHSA